jgi:transitional endoplasmic reticulum ATPase
MVFELIMDRAQTEDIASSKCLASMDKKKMVEQGLQVGDILMLTSYRGREALVRLSPPLEEDTGTNIIRLERFTKQALKAKLNETIEAKKIFYSPVKKIVLIPAIDVTTAHDLESHIRETLVNNQTPVAIDSVLYINFPHSTAGITYTIHDLEDGPGIITSETEIKLDYHEAHVVEGAIDITFEDVGGLEDQIRLVRELVQLPLQFPYAYTQLGIKAPRGIIFYGPPGTGKTYLARAVANEIGARFFFINGPDIIGTLSGETEGNLRRLFNEAAHHAPSIVIIDEIDAIAPKRGQTGTLSDTRAVTTLLSAMDGMQKVNGVIVIGTSNRVEAIDVALRRPGRFDREIFFPPPNAKGRLEILEIHSREMPLEQDALDYLPVLAVNTHGFVGADLMEICREAGLQALRRNSEFLKDYRKAIRFEAKKISIKKEDFEYSLKKIRPSAMREVLVTIPNVSWQDLGGLNPIKQRLREMIEMPLKKPEIFQEMNINPENGILLFGPAGTGKTLLAKAIANECGVNFISVEGPEIFGQWLGESEETIRHIFNVARQTAPTIIFFDQLEAIASTREVESESKTTERVVSQLLTELDGIEPRSQVIVLAATNRLDMVDKSILRSGRFGTHIFVPLPNEEERSQILKIHLRDTSLSPKIILNELVEYLARETDGFSGAELKSVCDEAKWQSLRSYKFEVAKGLTQESFEKALEVILNDRVMIQERERL